MGCGASRVDPDEPGNNARAIPAAAAATAGAGQNPQEVQQARPNPQPRRLSAARRISELRSGVEGGGGSAGGQAGRQTENSHSAIPTERLGRGIRNRSNRNSATLAEHYNLPLQAPGPWTSTKRTWTRAQIDRERYEFFETRVTGKPEIWTALKQVTELVRAGDVSTAQGIVDAIGLTLPTGKLEEGGYDDMGNLYKLTHAVLSDPVNLVSDSDMDGATFIGGSSDSKFLSLDKDNKDSLTSTEIMDEKVLMDKGKGVVDKDAILVKCRLSDRGGPDVIIQLGKLQPVGVLVRRIRDEVELSSFARLKIAYLGHMLDERKSLSESGWKEGHVVNALVLGVFDHSSK